MKTAVAMLLAGLCIFQASVMGSLVNVAPSATYSYSADWPGSPGIWGDSGTQLNDGNLTNIVIESAQEPLVVIFDLGSDKQISQLVVSSRETDWNNNGLTGCSFYANSEAQGKFTGYYNGNGMEKAAWATGVSAVDKSNTVWTVDTGMLSTPITARYIGIVADYGYGGTYNPAAISEVAIYSVPEPATIGLLLMGLLGIFRKRFVG
jgi:hypothetical protein